MKKHNIKNLSKTLSVDNKYEYVVIKLPDGIETLCRSTYTPSILHNINKDNVTVQQQKTNINYIYVSVDYKQHSRDKRNTKQMQLQHTKQTKRKELLTKKII